MRGPYWAAVALLCASNESNAVEYGALLDVVICYAGLYGLLKCMLCLEGVLMVTRTRRACDAKGTTSEEGSE